LSCSISPLSGMTSWMTRNFSLSLPTWWLKIVTQIKPLQCPTTWRLIFTILLQRIFDQAGHSWHIISQLLFHRSRPCQPAPLGHMSRLFLQLVCVFHHHTMLHVFSRQCNQHLSWMRLSRTCCSPAFYNQYPTLHQPLGFSLSPNQS
jgi:hypothetical protein